MQKIFLGCVGSGSNFYTQYSAACLHYAHSQRQHPAPAPNLHHAHNQQPGGTLSTTAPAPSTGTPAHSTTRAQPAPGTLFPPRAQPADRQHPAPAPSTHTQLAPRAQPAHFFPRARTPCGRCAQVIMRRMETLHIGKGKRTRNRKTNTQKPHKANQNDAGNPNNQCGQSFALYYGETCET